MYYALIILSVVVFGGNFALNDVYRKMRGSTLRVALESSVLGGIAGLMALLLLNLMDLSFACTPFTLIMSLICAASGFCFTFFSFKALDHVNLSLYAVFSMLGGMLLPFLLGIGFFGEGITLAKVICVLLIAVALAMTVSFKEKKRGLLYCIGIFFFNGMSGVLSKLFTELPFEKTSAFGYSFYSAAFSIVIGAVLYLVLFAKKNSDMPYTWKALIVCAAKGASNRIANYILVIALAHVAASVQYPMVTGGTMIVSTLLCYLGDRRPSRRELCSVAVAFLSMLALFVIPI